MKPLTVLWLIGIFLIAMAQALFIKLELYWIYPSLDIPMHFAGGVLLTLFLWVLVVQKILPVNKVTNWYWPTIFTMTLIIAWEVVGVVIRGGLKPNFWSDTFGDIVFGIIGAIVGYFIGKSYNKNKHE